MRFAKKRDQNDSEIFDALRIAGCDPVRCTDFDIGAAHADGYGVMIEVKTAKGRLRPIQERLKDIFKDRYRVARSVEEALIAVGRMV
jgi:hypothetical protein